MTRVRSSSLNIRSLHLAWWFATLCALSAAAAAQTTGHDDSSSSSTDDGSPNSNRVLKAYEGKVKVTASTTYDSWPTDKLIDGDPQTSWFSATGDSVAAGAKPWIQIELPDGAVIHRVTLVGNREPSYPKGYSVLEGELELLDKTGKRLWSSKQSSQGDEHDFNFRPPKPIKGVQSIRFTPTKDEGKINGSRDIAMGEVQVE